MTDKLENSEALLYRAAEIKTQLKALESEYQMIAPQVISRIKELSASPDKYALRVGELGVFSIASYLKWTYSQATQERERLLKELKKIEEANGTATAEESEVLKFNTPTKPNE